MSDSTQSAGAKFDAFDASRADEQTQKPDNSEEFMLEFIDPTKSGPTQSAGASIAAKHNRAVRRA